MTNSPLPPSFDWLARTKFIPPPPHAGAMVRQRLVDALAQAVAGSRLTLVSAPAGSGKTTLLAGFCRVTPALPSAWLTLDEDDSDLARFLAGLALALQHLNPACGTGVLALLPRLPNPAAEVRRLLSVLINDILETLPGEFVLLLDDLHAVTEPAVYAALDFLLERLPPQMRIVVATRHDPPLGLARLRARGQLTELRLPALRFTAEEANAYLNTHLGLGLSAEDLSTVQARVEGWAAGVSLTGGSLSRISEQAARSQFVHDLSSTDRYLFDFLADEVLDRLDEPTRDFLLHTSLLEELTPDLCAAVTGRSDAWEALEDLRRRNLFVLAAEFSSAPRTKGAVAYRYHALFAAFLRQRLAHTAGRDLIAELHRRAGRAETVPSRALRHLLAAEDWEAAAGLLERIGPELLRQGQLDSLHHWIEALPAATLEAHPHLLYYLGRHGLHHQEVHQAATRLTAALRGFTMAQNAPAQGQALAALATAAFFQGDFPQCLDYITQALALPLPAAVRVQLLLERTRLHTMVGRYDQGVADVADALDLADTSPEPDALSALLNNFMLGYFGLPGVMDRMERICGRASLREEDDPLLAAALQHQWMAVHQFRGRVTASLRSIEQALALSERFGGLPPWQRLTLATSALTIGTIRGHRPSLDPMLGEMAAPGQILPAVLVGFLYAIGHLCWLQGRTDDARRLSERLRSFPQQAPLVLCWMASLQGLLHLSAGNPAAAERSLREAAALEKKLPLVNFCGSARIQFAAVLLQQGRRGEALAEADAALADLHRRGAPGLALVEGELGTPVLRLVAERGTQAELAARLLAELHPGAEGEGEFTPVRIAETGETLSAREVQVLRLVAAGSSNREIAERLVITERTVKSHMTSIMSKLNVSSRTQAIACARDLRLL